MARVTEGKLDARLATLPGRLKAERDSHEFDMRLRRMARTPPSFSPPAPTLTAHFRLDFYRASVEQCAVRW